LSVVFLTEKFDDRKMKIYFSVLFSFFCHFFPLFWNTKVTKDAKEETVRALLWS